jgi:hypothetical protein
MTAGLAGATLAAFLIMPSAAAGSDEDRTFVFRLRFQGLVASAVWTTCPQPSVGDVCTDTVLLAFDAATREGQERSTAPVVRTLTFVYRVVGGDIGAVPVAEWFGRTEDAAVDSTPRLTEATATADVPVQICTIFEPESGLTCPQVVPVDAVWTGTGPLERTNDHNIRREPIRLENTWNRGWQRTASIEATVGTAPLGTLVNADLVRIDQGEIIVQHPFA